MENQLVIDRLKEMETVKKRLNGVAQRIRNKNKMYWGAETTLKFAMTKSQSVKKRIYGNYFW